MSTLCLPTIQNTEGIEFDLTFKPSQFGYESYIVKYDVPSTFTTDHTAVTNVSNLTNVEYGVGFNVFGTDSLRSSTIRIEGSSISGTYYPCWYKYYASPMSSSKGSVVITLTASGFRKTIKLKQYNKFYPINFIIKHNTSASSISINNPTIVNNDDGYSYLLANEIYMDGYIAVPNPIYYSNGDFISNKIKDVEHNPKPLGNYKFGYISSVLSSTASKVGIPLGVAGFGSEYNTYVIEGEANLLTYNNLHVSIAYTFETPYKDSYPMVNQERTIDSKILFLTNPLAYKSVDWTTTSNGKTTNYLLYNVAMSLCIENVARKENFYVPFIDYIYTTENAVTNKEISTAMNFV